MAGTQLLKKQKSRFAVPAPRAPPTRPFLLYVSRSQLSWQQISSPDGKHKYTYYENVDGEDEEDEDVSQDGSWEANLKAQCRCWQWRMAACVCVCVCFPEQSLQAFPHQR